MAFTYNGATNPPVATGSYTVVGTVVAPEYAGSATGTLIITAGDFAPWFNPMGVQTSLVGIATSFVASANGSPAPALALLITLPAVSVPSLIMLRKAFPAKALWLTGGLVALCGAIVGALALV